MPLSNGNKTHTPEHTSIFLKLLKKITRLIFNYGTPKIALAEALVRTRSLESGLAYELIAARADLAAIVSGVRLAKPDPDVRTLEGWRRALVGDELLSMLRGELALRVGPDGRVEVTQA